jgi:hypothetical protein
MDNKPPQLIITSEAQPPPLKKSEPHFQFYKDNNPPLTKQLLLPKRSARDITPPREYRPPEPPFINFTLRDISPMRERPGQNPPIKLSPTTKQKFQ